MEDKDFDAQNRSETCTDQRHGQGKVEERFLDGFEAGKSDSERDCVTEIATPRKPIERGNTGCFF